MAATARAGGEGEGRPAPVPALAPLRVAAYRRVWLAMTVSHLGTYLQLSAAPWLMLQMTGSPFLVSLVLSALLAPRLVLTLPAGALADVLDRRTIMLVGQGLSAVATGALAVVVALDALTPTVLLAFTLLLGAGSAIDKVSYQTLVADLVPKPLRAQAITLNSGAHHAARIVGPSIGGLLVALGVAQAAFAGNCASFLLVMLVLSRMPPDRRPAAREGDRGPRSTTEGFRFVRANPALRRLLVVTAAFTLSSASVQALLPNVVDEIGLGAQGFGVLYGVFGAGALLAAVTRERASAALGPQMVPGTIALFGFAAMTLGLSSSAVVAGAALVFAGLAWVWTMTTLNATVQLSAPRWVRGRVVALYVMAVAMKPVGAFVSGVTAELLGAGAAVAAMSVTTVLLAVVASRARMPSLAQVGDGRPGDGPAAVLTASVATPTAPGPPPTLARRPLKDVELPYLGLGCMSMSHPGRSDAESRATLHAAFDAGIRLFDTADRYGRGHNETLVADALRTVRDEVVVATKVGFVGKPGRDARPVDGSPAHLRAACDASLARLGTDVIDLLYLHRVDPRVPVEESVGAMQDLVRVGKVRWLALSEVDAATLVRALREAPVTAVQNEYSLASRDVERDLLPTCDEHGVAFVASSPLGIGLLTGGYAHPTNLPAGNRLARGPRIGAEHLGHNLGLVAELRRLADEAGCTAAQLALGWVLAQGVFAVPGSSGRAHLHENVRAGAVELPPDVVARLEATFAPGAVRGARKPPPGLALTPG